MILLEDDFLDPYPLGKKALRVSCLGRKSTRPGLPDELLNGTFRKPWIQLYNGIVGTSDAQPLKKLVILSSPALLAFSKLTHYTLSKIDVVNLAIKFVKVVGVLQLAFLPGRFTIKLIPQTQDKLFVLFDWFSSVT